MKPEKKNVKKLRLNKVTIAGLSSSVMDNIYGGFKNTSAVYPPTSSSCPITYSNIDQSCVSCPYSICRLAKQPDENQ